MGPTIICIQINQFLYTEGATVLLSIALTVGSTHVGNTKSYRKDVE